MRLIDLEPHWVTFTMWSSASPFYFGISFLCPHCGIRLAVPFWPPVDPKGFLGRTFDMPSNNGHHRKAGETFETLTLEPSVKIESHWHGHIVDGNLVAA